MAVFGSWSRGGKNGWRAKYGNQGEKGRQSYIALPSCPYQPLCFYTASMMN